jgi:CheY-like chemotaxis protein
MLLEIFGLWLATAGCVNVYTATNGEDALTVLKTIEIDLLVTDIRMPIMDGVSLVRRIGGTNGVIPTIVFVSGFGDIDHREMYSLGVEAFIAKPLQRDQLVSVLERAIAERSELWLKPMPAPPRQSMVTEMKDRSPIHVGRGGFSTHYSSVLSLGKIAFRCNIPREPFEMVGEGYVRWFSKTENAVGIEFHYLDPACRPWVLEQIATIGPRCFIPGLLENSTEEAKLSSAVDSDERAR